MIKEIWRAVIGYEGLYEVSDQGRVRSLNYHRTGELKIINQSKHKHGYLTVVLSKNGITKTFRVHRLVARTFPEICGEWFEGCVINHINCITTDCRAVNLETCTQKHNCNWADRIEKIIKTKLKPVAQYTLEGVLVATYPSVKEAARQTGINQGNISRCCSGKTKTAGGFIWKYI